MKTNSNFHYSVLLNETINALDIKSDGIYVDLTMGMGGHSEAILQKLTTGKLYCFDRDDFAINQAKKRLEKISNNFEIIKSNFADFKKILLEKNIFSVDGIIADLGVSSPQIDNPERGFSYNHDSFLDMRMDQKQTLTAYDVVNKYTQEDLKRILTWYGEVKNATQLSQAIIKNRNINTTLELVNVIKQNTPQKILKKKNPAKNVFQAIRIEVNSELDSLKTMLHDATSMLKQNGKLAIITFHSLEDKIVKHYFKTLIENKLPSKLPIMEEKHFNVVSISPSNEEILINSRSKSAKLRILTKLI